MRSSSLLTYASFAIVAGIVAFSGPSSASDLQKNTSDTSFVVAMNWDRVEGNWKQVSGKAKQQWGKLTDDDLTRANGHREELAGRLQERYGITKDEADRQVDKWMDSVD